VSKQRSTSTENKDIESEIKRVLKETEQAQKLVNDNSKKTLKMLKELIHSTPEVLAIRWSQYIPGFNDGEPCEFSINDLEIKFNPEYLPVNTETTYNDRGEEEEDDHFVSGDYIDDFFNHQMDVINVEEISRLEKKVQLFYDMHNALSSHQDTLRTMFDDNSQITVTREGIQKEKYDCGY
jgi:hypothetical protein